MKTFDQRTIDSAGAFLVGELERFDTTLHMPLASVSWNRDIDLRTDVTIADEVSSFINITFAAVGGINPNGKNFVSGGSTEIPSLMMDAQKTPSPMRIWALQLAWTLVDLAKALQTGRPLDRQSLEGLKLKHNMDIDEMVYVGDTAVGATGLLNNPGVSPENVTNNWETATPEQILADVNDIIEMGWNKTGYAVCPADLLLPPRTYSSLTKPVSLAGSKSILTYLAEECISNGINGKPLDIRPLKWLTKAGVAGANRACAYTKNEQYVRFPMVPLQHTPVEYRGLHHITTYFGSLGEVEFVYPETITYADGM